MGDTKDSCEGGGARGMRKPRGGSRPERPCSSRGPPEQRTKQRSLVTRPLRSPAPSLNSQDACVAVNWRSQFVAAVAVVV
jgi:hypothetical protein